MSVLGISFLPACLCAQPFRQVSTVGRTLLRDGSVLTNEQAFRDVILAGLEDLGRCTMESGCGALLPREVPVSTVPDFSRFDNEPPSSIYPSGNNSGQITLAYVKSDEIESFSDEFKDANGKMRSLIRRFRDANSASYQPEYLAPRERKFYREQYNKLAALAQEPPSSVDRLRPYLRHAMPPETFLYIQRNYLDYSVFSQEAAKELGVWLTYSMLPLEGRKLVPMQVRYYMDLIQNVKSMLKPLLRAMPQNPYLEAQDEYWDTWEYTVFPLVNNQKRRHVHDALRVDNRKYVYNEFFLHNPDGTKYYLPETRTLLKDDPDEEDEEESWAAVKARMMNPIMTEPEIVAERERLLKDFPSDLRIAFINDDSLPRVNFTQWSKKGYLGENASLDTFSDGLAFLESVEHGHHYDIVITDLEVPFAGSAMMPKLRQLEPNIAVIACSKYDDIAGAEYFEDGFDGYLWYNSNLNNGMWGYIEYLRAMKNYFYYRNLHKWQR